MPEADKFHSESAVIEATTDISVLRSMLQKESSATVARTALARLAKLFSDRIQSEVEAQSEIPRRAAWNGRQDQSWESAIAFKHAVVTAMNGGRRIEPGSIVTPDEFAQAAGRDLDGLDRDFQAGELAERLAHVDEGKRSAAIFALADLTGDVPRAMRFYWLAFAFDAVSDRAGEVASRMFKRGSLSNAASMLQRHDGFGDNVIRELQFCAGFLEELPRIPERRRPIEGSSGRIAYVASSSLNFQTAGYTVRTQKLLTALKKRGVDTYCLVRPGYPWDRLDAKDEGAGVTVSEGIRYIHTPVPKTLARASSIFEDTVTAFEIHLRTDMPRVVHAASNFRSALPALVAARRIGIPFVYEVRGFWELSKAARFPGWEDTEDFALSRALEHLVVTESDFVLAITESVAQALVEGGADPKKIGLLPNAVDPDEFKPEVPDRALVTRHGTDGYDLVLVYCGAMIAYEGLDDLLEAIALLRDRGLKVRLLLVGDGEYRDRLRRLVTIRKLSAFVSFVDPVPPNQVWRYLSLSEVVVFPRKPSRVCELVSPLKPYEAMAMEKTVVLSDLKVSREIVENGVTGVLCKPAQPASLAGILEILARDPALRRRIGKAARQWVLANRNWDRNADTMVEVYDRLAKA